SHRTVAATSSGRAVLPIGCPPGRRSTRSGHRMLPGRLLTRFFFTTPSSAVLVPVEPDRGRIREVGADVDRHRQPPALAADPPPPGHRRMGLPLLPPPRRPAGV